MYLKKNQCFQFFEQSQDLTKMGLYGNYSLEVNCGCLLQKATTLPAYLRPSLATSPISAHFPGLVAICMGDSFLTGINVTLFWGQSIEHLWALKESETLSIIKCACMSDTEGYVQILWISELM